MTRESWRVLRVFGSATNDRAEYVEAMPFQEILTCQQVSAVNLRNLISWKVKTSLSTGGRAIPTTFLVSPGTTQTRRHHGGVDAVVAVRAVTQTIPIVAFGPDPVAQGFAQSLSRPGGNVTGILILAAELDGKRLELLNEAVPAKKVAVLVHASAPSAAQSRQETTAAASRLGIEPLVLQTGGPDEYPAVFAAIRAAGIRAVVITANAWFYRDRDLLLQLASEARLATICEWGDMAANGCLIGYGPRRLELYRRAADLIARIFRGAHPADLPVEQPAKFDLVINLNTANALALTIPPSFLARADEVIE